MAIQYIRVKSVREMLFDATNCLEQVLTEMDAPPEVIKKYCVDKLKLSNIHKEMILNQNEIKHLSGIFSNYVWILRINRTNNVFFTSDNPIGVIPHKHHPYISTAGLQSEGVEICFPISPKIMLSMFEKNIIVCLQNTIEEYRIWRMMKTLNIIIRFVHNRVQDVFFHAMMNFRR